ncbi:MAG: glycosyltransferase family 4 protein [Anaerolineales bacterium]|nr:glycosyltransferase family 4 protein [Anaerolineales bacterium]
MSIPRGIRSLLSLATPRLRNQPSLYYIAPFVNWVLDWEAHYITRNVKEIFGLNAHVVKSAKGLSGQLVHYGSLWDILANVDAKHNKRNTVIGTIFHGHIDSPEFSDALDKILRFQDRFARLHTASTIMYERFLKWGVRPEKLIFIPLGVDLERFKPATAEQRLARRRELGIPEDAFCIGSFHKDGQGMAEGNVPKLIKGPDILVDALTRIHARHKNIFVLLSAPARGYVKLGLDAAGIRYVHVVEEDFHRIPRLFDAIDVYLLASREEGGPKGVLEALASGVPFVGTQVGLVPDVVTDEQDGLLTSIEDSAALASAVEQLIEDAELRQQLIEHGLQRIQQFGWPLIASRYYRELYEPLLPVLK